MLAEFFDDLSTYIALINYHLLLHFRGQQAKIKEHKVLVDQLKRELTISRVMVSESVKDLIKVNM